MINLSAMDMGLSIGFFAIFALFGSLDYTTIFSIVPFMNETAITIIGLLLLTGAMAKSAQIPLHSWLPGSMEGTINPLYSLLKLFLYTVFYFLITSYDWAILEINFIELSEMWYQINEFNFSNCIIYISSMKFSTRIERDSKGRFIKIINPFLPLPEITKDALIGELLGYGHLRGTRKDQKGNIKGNCHFAITLKSYDHVFYLWKEIYSYICTETPIRPWPKAHTGKTPSQYAFSSKSLVSFSENHKQWYILNEETKKFTKIVPLNISKLLTSRGLAHWLMGDGYWNTADKTVVICTDNFTEIEVELLIKTLKDNFDLLATKRRRIKANKEVCWRIRFSSKSENITKLRTLVEPYFIPSMYYKLNIDYLPNGE